MNQSKRAVLTTQEAADRLGVSTTSIQKMVDRGELEAWVTPGGHRRIYSDSVEHVFQSNRRSPSVSDARPARPTALRVLLAEDEPEQVALLQRLMSIFGDKIELSVAEDASQALIQIERQRPDVVVADLIMKPFDGFHLVRTIVAEDAYASIDVMVISGMPPDEVARRGGLPPGVLFYNKPVSVDRLIGVMDAALARVMRRGRLAGAGAGV
jgi:excisionase family DNA binding protein